MEIAFITSNKAKVKLANERLNRYGIAVVQRELELIEPQTLDVVEVVTKKAEQAERVVDTSFIVEDSGLYINGLNGFPGALMKPVLDSIGDSGILKMMSKVRDRKVLVRSVLAYCNPKSKQIESFTGLYHGRLAETAAGTDSRGWKVSRIFIPDGADKTLAEMDDEEWKEFLEEFRKNDHYKKFGSWFEANKD